MEPKTHSQRHSGRSSAAKAVGSTLLMVSRFVLAALLFIAPLLWGGRHPLAQGVMGITVGVVALLWSLGVFFRGRWTRESAPGLWVLLPVLGMLALQMVPGVFSCIPAPVLADIWSNAAHIVDVGAARFAVKPEGQWQGVCAVATAAATYWLTVQLFGYRLRMLWLAVAMALAGGVTAITGLCQVFGGWDWFLWLYKGAEKTASAGYFNRDHFAQLGGLTVFIALGLATGILMAPHGSRMAEWAHGRRWLGWVSAAVAVAALVAVIFSYSRAAILAVTAGLLFFMAALWLVRGKRTLSLPMATVGLALFIASFYGLDVLTERVAFVLSGTDPSALVRREIWQTVMDVIAMSPWFGSGWDGVAALASTLDTSYIPGFFVNAAHNDYLELMVIVGVPVACWVFACSLWWYGRTFFRLVALGHRKSSFYPLASGLFIGVTAVLAQEAVEYGLRQPANLVFFVVACGLLGLVLETAESDKTHGESRQQVLGVSELVVVTIVTVVAASGTWLSVELCCEGWRQVQLETAAQTMRTNTSLPQRLVYGAWETAAKDVLAVNPKNVAALTAIAEVKLKKAELLRQESLARALSELLERTVSPRQAERSVYAPYWEKATQLISQSERAKLAQAFAEAETAALSLARVSPSNASAVSMAAGASDEKRFWLAESLTAVKEHRYSAALAPSSVAVLSRSVRGLALACAASDGHEKDGLVRDFSTYAKRLFGEVPSTLSWILPMTASVGMSSEATAELVPEKIQGQELYARWLIKNGQFESALVALDKAQKLNDGRLDDEKPWTMGRAAYLAREKREKTEVAQVLDGLRLAAYQGIGDDIAQAEVSERMKLRETAIHQKVLERADALMASGDWVLADELLKKLKTDPRALVRRAEMALTMNRLEGAGQRLKEFEAVENLADEKTKARAKELRTRLKP